MVASSDSRRLYFNTILSMPKSSSTLISRGMEKSCGIVMSFPGAVRVTLGILSTRGSTWNGSEVLAYPSRSWSLILKVCSSISSSVPVNCVGPSSFNRLCKTPFSLTKEHCLSCLLVVISIVARVPLTPTMCRV